ncbi:O-antigen ligase family protein [Nitratireductor sp. GCM10026969]|uniref:O-antigen ligase family protein n=1 Tax=Nitratireductor sp. GCM10026969 TaxID=3252645 RepID=UPI0036207AD5
MREDPPSRYFSTAFARDVIAHGLLLIFISAVWIESDAYRYVALAALLPVTVIYFRSDFRSEDKPLIGYIGLLCIAWGIYVATRFLYDATVYSEAGIGSSEGIYLFPLFYTISGYALLVGIRRPFIAVVAFVLISFIVAAVSFDPMAIVEGRRAEVVLHENPIHAATAQGMVVLCMLPFASYLLRRDDMRGTLRAGLVVLSFAILFLGLANIYALESKGVWVALAAALPVQLLLIATMHSARRGVLAILGLAFAAVVVTVFVAWDGIRTVAGDTAEAMMELLSAIADGSGLLESMGHAIRDYTVPESLRERLMLWASAILIWAEAPIFGQGVTWLDKWQTRAYPAADYNLLHNGYLEIAIRYGVVGLIFYAVLFSWVIRQVWRAKREGIIDSSAFNAFFCVFLFFCVTIFSNSNIRLAIGESYLWFCGAFGFYCFYRRQRQGCVSKPTTWI